MTRSASLEATSQAASGATHTPTKTSARKGLIALYMTAVFLYWIGLYLYVPTLPVYVQSKTSDLALVGVVLSMYGLWQAIIRLPLGIAADWLGWRKPFIVGGFALTALGAWLMGSSADVDGLIVGRAITGLAAGTWVPLVVVFSGLFPPEDAVRASALLTVVGSVGRMLATGVTGSLNDWGGYSLAFYLAAGAAIVAMVIVLPTPETRRPPKRPSIGGIGRLITRRDVLLPSVLSAVSQYANWATTFGFMPILARQLGATDVIQSVLVSMNIAVLTVGNLLVTAIVRRTGSRRLVYASFILLALGITAAAMAKTLAAVFAAQFLIGLSQGVGYPLLMGLSIERVADEQRTTAMGLHQAVYAIGMFTGPWLSGMLANAIGIQPMFAITAAVALMFGFIGTRQMR
ncbi:MAG: MFS transporter [Anaerolineae bacterium]